MKRHNPKKVGLGMNGNSPQRVVVAANFSIEPIGDPLRRLLDKVFLSSEIVFAPYNQNFQQLLDPESLFHSNRNGMNIVFVRLEDLIESREEDVRFVRSQLERIKTIASDFAGWLRAAERFSVPLFVFTCPPSARIQADPGLASEFEAIERTLRDSVSNVSNVFIFGTGHMVTRYRLTTIDNPTGNVLGHVPYTTDFISALAIETARMIDAFRRKPFKALVLDCDNTIWDGIVGEDGVRGIGLSGKRLFLQEFAIEQSESGMVVCLNSKNNEADVWEVFDNRNDMVLKKEHIVSSRINWFPKSQNLISIAEELQLGLDSFVFVDDDPVVCSEVNRNCPEVFTVMLPAGSDDYRRFFDHLWVFDKLKVTQEDGKRTRSYRDETGRRELRAKAGDMTEFLKSLELVCEIEELDIQDLPRVSQLTLRTNQFNSTTIRLSESDIRRLIFHECKRVLTVRVRDRFGEYGLVGVVIFEEQEDSISVDALILSCRVLGRGVEYEILRSLGRRALEANRKLISIKFLPTAKNAPALNFLSEVGDCPKATADGQTIYRIPAEAAIECRPRSGQLKEKKRIVKTHKSAVPNEVSNSVRFRFYSETAQSLSSGGVTKLNGTASELSRSNLTSEFRAARTGTERTLTQIWEYLLSKKNIGTADNFFEMGGDSLIAVALFVEIEERFGRSLPLTSLIDSPTIENLSRVIESDPDDAAWRYLVPIKPHGSSLPLFCMHAAGGNVLFYLDLANELGNELPVYGLQARGIADKSETAHDRIEDMAADYLTEIRQLQPHGPYRLCGSSFGGLVAFEAAKQLLDVGEQVSMLAVFDTYAPGYLSKNSLKPGPFSRLKQLIERVRNAEIQLLKIGKKREQMRFIFDRIRRLKDRQKRKLLWKKNEFAIQYSKATGRELPNDMMRNHNAIRKAEDDYRPGSLDGKLILIRATEQPAEVAFEPLLGWGPFIKLSIVTEEVKGTHGAIAVYPSAVELAGKLKSHLNERKVPVKPSSAVSSQQVRVT